MLNKNIKTICWLASWVMCPIFNAAHSQEIQINAAHATAEEATYFQNRDQYVAKYFHGPQGVPVATFDVETGKALKDLDGQIRKIVGPVNVKGFSPNGSSNLQTLVQELGFDMVDGMRFVGYNEPGKFNNAGDVLFVTTKNVLDNYLGRHPEFPKSLDLLTETGKFGIQGNFYSLVFDDDASVTTYAELPVKRGPQQTYVRAFVGITSQDIGPAVLPNQLFVVATKEQKVFVVSASIRTEIDQIPSCQQVSENLWQKSEEALDAYIKSKLANKSLSEKSDKLEMESFDGFQKCFAQEAKNQSYYLQLVNEVQEIVNRL